MLVLALVVIAVVSYLLGSVNGAIVASNLIFHDDIRKPYEVGCAIQKKRLECAIMVQAQLNLEKEEGKSMPIRAISMPASSI